MKYIASIGIMLLVSNEIFSLLCLMAIVAFFFADIAKARMSL